MGRSHRPERESLCLGLVGSCGLLSSQASRKDPEKAGSSSPLKPQSPTVSAVSSSHKASPFPSPVLSCPAPLRLSHLLWPWSSRRAQNQGTMVLGATHTCVSDPSKNPGAKERTNYGPRIKTAAKQLCRVEGMFPSETHFPIPGLPRMHSFDIYEARAPHKPRFQRGRQLARSLESRTAGWPFTMDAAAAAVPGGFSKPTGNSVLTRLPSTAGESRAQFL